MISQRLLYLWSMAITGTYSFALVLDGAAKLESMISRVLNRLTVGNSKNMKNHLHPHHTAPAANAIVGICTVVEHKYGVIATLAKQRAAQAADGLRR